VATSDISKTIGIIGGVYGAGIYLNRANVIHKAAFDPDENKRKLVSQMYNVTEKELSNIKSYVFRYKATGLSFLSIPIVYAFIIYKNKNLHK
jgi:hypothetical protein